MHRLVAGHINAAPGCTKRIRDRIVFDDAAVDGYAIVTEIVAEVYSAAESSVDGTGSGSVPDGESLQYRLYPAPLVILTTGASAPELPLMNVLSGPFSDTRMIALP